MTSRYQRALAIVTLCLASACAASSPPGAIRLWQPAGWALSSRKSAKDRPWKQRGSPGGSPLRLGEAAQSSEIRKASQKNGPSPWAATSGPGRADPSTTPDHHGRWTDVADERLGPVLLGRLPAFRGVAVKSRTQGATTVDAAVEVRRVGCDRIPAGLDVLLEAVRDSARALGIRKAAIRRVIGSLIVPPRRSG